MPSTDLRLTKNFWLWEFMPLDLYREVNHYILKRLLDERLVQLLQYIRTDLDRAIYVNNWKNGGYLVLSGYRPPDCDVGSTWSQHKYGRAADTKVSGMPPLEFRQYLVDRQKVLMPLGLRRIETNTTTWTHLDLGWTSLPSVVKFAPPRKTIAL